MKFSGSCGLVTLASLAIICGVWLICSTHYSSVSASTEGNVSGNRVETINATSTKFATYENSTQGIKILYPENWEIIKGSGVAFLSPLENNKDTFREGLLVSGSSSPGKTLTELVNGVLKFYNATIPNFHLLESNSSSSLAGNKAHSLVYKFIDTMNHNQTMRAMDIGTLKGDNLFVVQYAAQDDKFQSYLPVIRKMINSFEIVK
jgi:serine/threonine-protein kinase